MSYQQRINAILPRANARHVEAFMRSEYGTLDHLSAQAFESAARECAEAVRQEPVLAERLAETFWL